METDEEMNSINKEITEELKHTLRNMFKKPIIFQ